MIYIYGLLSGLFEISQMMHGRAWRWDVAQQRWVEATPELEDNVVYVDFEASRNAEERM